jgi:1-aminocyclopropane-1-carboxylate deaminase/D-cysteine desulfhydrase-like pyridoxal-dependent ACC family enzyme
MLDVLTPVQKVGDMWFKRDDYFAPLGIGGINGTKVRQGIYIFNEYVKGRYEGIVGAMSVHSPQHSFQAVVAKHFGIQSYHIVGATKPHTAIKQEDISIAAALGGKFKIIKVAYNPALQRATRDFVEEHKDVYPLGYAISVPHETYPAADVEKFHAISAEQVRNVPDHITNIVIPFGSGNSATSILYGIAKYKPKSLKNVYLVGIGPSKIRLVEERLNIISQVSGVNCKPFTRFYPQHKKIAEEFGPSIFDDDISPDEFHYNLIYDDLHAQKIVKYGEDQKASYEGINFFGNYEGKVWNRMANYYKTSLINPQTLFWIIGSRPYLEGFRENLGIEKQPSLQLI